MPDKPRYWRALLCPCGLCPGAPSTFPGMVMLQATAEWLEEVERVLGGDPLLILVGGGYRCPEYAATVEEGIPGPDYHQQGLAVDFTLEKHSPVQAQRHLVRHLGKLVAGLASFPGYTHITRPPAEFLKWRPNVLTPKG